MISDNEIMFGDNSLSGGGFFSGGQVLVINIGMPKVQILLHLTSLFMMMAGTGMVC